MARLLGVVIAALLGPVGARAQDVAAGRGIALSQRPATTLVAVTAVVPVGSADDPDDAPGTARLVAEGVARTVRWRIDPDAARVEVRVERGYTAFTLLATPDVWETAWGVLEDHLFRVPLEEAPLEAAREDLLKTFTFEEGAPVREFQRELYMTLGGATSPWSRDPRGTPESLKAVVPAALEDFRATHYQLATATAAVVGPITQTEARAALDPVGTQPVPESPTERIAWRRGDRIGLERNVTNSWIAAMYPAPRDLPRTELDFLAHEVQEALNPSPPDPGLFSLTVRIEDTPRGPVMVVEAAVMPEVQEVWEKRILNTIAGLQKVPSDALFTFHRRRFRNQILVREGAPELAALRMALDLQREGRVRPLQDQIWALGPKELAKTAQALGEPRVLLMGPEMDPDGGKGR
jgi:hypothetical protein